VGATTDDRERHRKRAGAQPLAISHLRLIGNRRAFLASGGHLSYPSMMRSVFGRPTLLFMEVKAFKPVMAIEWGRSNGGNRMGRDLIVAFAGPRRRWGAPHLPARHRVRRALGTVVG
jgi:hypothetical protein